MMRAFFCLYLTFSWVLFAQEKLSFEKFEIDYTLIKKEIGDAKDRTITVDQNWVEGHSTYLYKMVSDREWLKKNAEPLSVKEAVSNIDLQSLIDDLVFVGKRLIVERNIQIWTLDDIKPQMTLLSQELNRFEQSRPGEDPFDQIGFIGLHELYRPSKILWDLNIIDQVLKNNEFVSRVCKDVDGCTEQIDALKKKVREDQVRSKSWIEKAKK